MYFLLNQNLQPLKIDNINPNTTILQFIRERGLTGTKEGCASGDCGACVAAVGELNDDNIVYYKSINTCISLAYSLIGKHLITVEGLQLNGQLHPVQKAMVVCHGSQCGFCTPGFVMSLFTLYKQNNENAINLPIIKDYLSGNLCRCTGYKPIIEAAFLACKPKNKIPDFYEIQQTKITSALKKIQTPTSTLIFNKSGNTIRFDAPTTIIQLATLLNSNHSAKLIAGGSDLVLDITQKLQNFKHLITTTYITKLQQIIIHNNEIELYSAVSFNKALTTLHKHYPSLEYFLERFASRPIKNWASICANIANASPIGDMPPVFIALGAKLKLVKLGAKQTLIKRTLNIADFFLSYRKTALQQGEFIKSVVIPKLKPYEKLLVYKISKRFEDDISTVCIAIKLSYASIKDKSPQHACIAFGGMADIPKRTPQLEKTLIENWHEPNLASIALKILKKTFTPINDVRASAYYRLEVAANLLQKCVLELKGETLPSVEHFLKNKPSVISQL